MQTLSILLGFLGAVFFPAFLFMLSRYLRKWRYEVRVYEFIKFINNRRIYIDIIEALGKIDKYYLKDIDEFIVKYFTDLISKHEPWEKRATIELYLFGLQKDSVMTRWDAAIRSKKIEDLIEIYIAIVDKWVASKLMNYPQLKACELLIDDILLAKRGDKLFFTNVTSTLEKFIKNQEISPGLSIDAKVLFEFNLALIKTQAPTGSKKEIGMMSS